MPLLSQTLLLNWLCAVVTDDQSRRPFPAFASPAVTRYLFTDYLANPAKMDFANLSKLGYVMFSGFRGLGFIGCRPFGV